jgi:hypothetical protein
MSHQNMNEITPAGEPQITPPPVLKPAPTFRVRVLKTVRRLSAIAVWLYLVTKIFIFDIDTYLVQKYAPSLTWVLDYKFFFYIGLLGIVAALFRKWQVIIFIGYVMFYPILLILWILPYAIFKSRSWIVAIAIINSVIRFFSNFRTNAIMAGVFVLSALLIFMGEKQYVLIAATSVMGAFVIAMYVLAVLAVFRPDPAFRMYSKACTATKNHMIKTNALGELALLPIDQFSELQLQKRRANIDMTVFGNRLFLFVASKFRLYQSSKISLLAGIFRCFWLVMMCVISFVCINYGIFKIDRYQYNPDTVPSMFVLIYYSFKTFISNSVVDLSPVGRLAEIASIAENVCGLFTLTIFVGTLFTQKNARQTKEIDDAVSQIELDAQFMERFLRSEFRVNNIEDAIAEMEKLKAGMLGIVSWLSRSIT